jgi:hypothetical protein
MYRAFEHQAVDRPVKRWVIVADEPARTVPAEADAPDDAPDSARRVESGREEPAA